MVSPSYVGSHAVVGPVVSVLGLAAFACCMTAEFNKATEKDVKLDGTLCSLPRTPAFGLGIAAITCLLVAQIVGMFALHRLLCCREKKGMLIMRITLLALSWVAFGFVVILLGTASSMNEGQAYGMGWLDGECYLVKHGIYVAAALLDVVTILCIFGLMYMARRAAPPPTLD